MELTLTALFFVIGTAIGSFLNVCAYRIPRKESVSFPPSHCPECEHGIAAYDNIPIISYLVLRARCRHCGCHISLRYPVVEALTGALWAGFYFHYGLSVQLACALFFGTVLIVLSVIDYDTKTIPDRLLLPSMAVSAVVALFYLRQIETVPVVAGAGLSRAATGFIAGGGLLLLIALLGTAIFKREAMGGGDVKLAAFMGLYLGGYVFIAIFIGTLLATIASVFLITRGKVSRQSTIPFGPYLAAGGVLTIFIGPQLWTGYLTLAGLA